MKLLAVVMTILLSGVRQEGSTELRFRVVFKTNSRSDKSADLRKVQQVLETRFRMSRATLAEARIRLAGDDQIILQVPTIGRDKLEECKKLVTQVGRIELKEVASGAINDDYKATKVVPPGYEAYTFKAGSEVRLVKAEPVITGEDIKQAEAQPSFETHRGGGAWHVAFEMSDKGGKKFDEIAKKLFQQDPRGCIAIIVDGHLDAVPQVQAEEFHGRGQISGGYNEAEARRLVIVLRSGALPVEKILVADEGAERK